MLELEEADDFFDGISVIGHQTDGRERHGDDAGRNIRQVQVKSVLFVHVTHLVLGDFL